MDECADVVAPLGASRFDTSDILENYAHVDGKLVSWDCADYRGEFDPYKNLCTSGGVGFSNGQFLRLMPVKLFRAFKSVFLSTYMFDSSYQRGYYDHFGVQYRHWHVAGDSRETYFFAPGKDKVVRAELGSLIRVCDDERLNSIGTCARGRPLCSSWYTNESHKAVKDATTSFFRTKVETASALNMWTCYSADKKSISASPYSKGFVAYNKRASNEHRHKASLAYLINLYMNPVVKSFFTSNQIQLDEDGWALASLTQWIFRSRVRDGLPVDVFIPSQRMRGLLNRWIECGGIYENGGKVE
jgi:hypothetical protein